VPGKPVATWPKSRNAKKVYLVEVGTENAKELIYSRLKIQPDTSGKPLPGCVHLPANDDICGEDELKQLTAETKELKIVKGRREYRWTAKGRRNEALDCFVYAIAALRISQQRFGLDLELLAGAKRAVPQRGTRSRVRG
jgi:phage terminase large subunit GpA-like protein